MTCPWLQGCQGGPCGQGGVFLGAWLVQPWIFCLKKNNFMDNKEVEILTEEWPQKHVFFWMSHDLAPNDTGFKKRMMCKKSLSLSQSPSRDAFHQKYGLFVQHCSPSPNSEYQKWDVLGPKPCNSEKNTILHEGVLVYKPLLATFHCFFCVWASTQEMFHVFCLNYYGPFHIFTHASMMGYGCGRRWGWRSP